MNIIFRGKYKSLTDFDWNDIPMFSVITGPNGTGKSQLLNIIYNTIVNNNQERERVQIENFVIQRQEVSFLKGEWNLSNTSSTDLSTIQSKRTNYYNTFRQNNIRPDDINQRALYAEFQLIKRTLGKNQNQITKEEFDEHFPDIIIEQEQLLSQKIEEIFYNYRLSEIEAKALGKTDDEIVAEIGEKPWVVLKEILKESKLPFQFNNPENNGIRDSFQLRTINEITGDSVNFNDLSSGEKVLISLVFYLYNSQEKNIFPKVILMDEPDAHLHPTMAQQFLNVIKNVLVDKFGVRVIMTTHSPSTVVLTPEESLFEMSRVAPRIIKSQSKNHTISLLTSGLVFVGEGTKYFLVEDKDDVDFYSYLFDHLTDINLVKGDIPLVFIPASIKNKSGGKDVVQNWVNKLQESGLQQLIQGLIDLDSGNEPSEGVFIIERYSIENYLIDPIITYAALMDKDLHNHTLNLGLKIGEEYKLKTLDTERLQIIADKIFDMVQDVLPKYFDDYNPDIENIKSPITFTNGITLQYPNWLIERRGKTLLNQAYNELFNNRNIHFGSLTKAMKKINFIPNDLLELFEQLKISE
jgi:ABC-type ATPase involved in cell division